MKVIKIEKSLPERIWWRLIVCIESLSKRKTFVCGICGHKVEETAFNPIRISKQAGDFLVQMTVCNNHFGLKDGGLVHSLELLKATFEVENKAKEILVVTEV